MSRERFRDSPGDRRMYDLGLGCGFDLLLYFRCFFPGRLFCLFAGLTALVSTAFTEVTGSATIEKASDLLYCTSTRAEPFTNSDDGIRVGVSFPLPVV